MPLMDEFREEREAMKNGTPQQKLQYFWDYYKWHTIAIVIGLICVISIARTILSAKDAALNVALLNCLVLTEDADASPFTQAYAEYAGIDTKKYEVRLDTNLTLYLSQSDQSTVNTLQKLMVSMAAGDLDVMIGGGEALAYYANASSFYDLRELLSPEQFAKYEPNFYYVDFAVVSELDKRRSNMEDTSAVRIPDPRKPEEMEIPIPVAVYIDTGKLEKEFFFQDWEAGIAIAVIVNSSQTENALSLIDYLMQL